jgi:alpha-glucosidase
VIYEIALISFQDSNGDGKGDLWGLLKRVDYLKWLGVDAVGSRPSSRSRCDFGYDIADYCAVDPTFGTLRFRPLLATLHEAGIRLILNLVPNRRSNEHPWFVESRSSPTGAKADWYLWAYYGRKPRLHLPLDFALLDTPGTPCHCRRLSTPISKRFPARQ